MHSGDFPGVIAILMIFGIPMVGMLLKHQRKMAEMFHAQAAPNAETHALREEIRELRALVHQQTIALDSLSRPTTTDDRLQDRVGA